MDLGLKDKIVVITGGTTGIGRAAAIDFAKEGAKPIVCGRSQAKIDAFNADMKKMGLAVEAVQCDVSSYEELVKLAEYIEKKYGGIDVLVNNAGIDMKKHMPLLDVSEETWNEIFNINLKGVWYGCKAFVPYLKKRGGGAIVNTSSFTSVMPTAGNGVYSMTKAALNHMTQLLAVELASYKIRVNAIIPGMIATDMTSANLSDEKIRAALLAPIGMRRFGTPEDMSTGIVFLASEAAGYVSGEQLRIAGAKFATQNPTFSWNL